MPLTTHILAGIQIPYILASLALIFLIFIFIIATILLVPLHISLNLLKKGSQIEGKLRTSWLGISLSCELISKETATEGRIWMSWLNLRLLEREIFAPSILDLLVSYIAKRDAEVKDNYKDEIVQDTENKSVRAEVEDEGDDTKMPGLRSVLAAIPVFIDLILDLIRAVALKTMRCRLEFGLDDPSQTAIISGWLWAIAAILHIPRADILIEPLFEEERLDGELLTEFKIRLLHLAVAAFSALHKKEIRSLIKEFAGRG